MSKNSLSIERTADGTQTVFSTQFDAHYHSIHGALQESKHVFIQEGIDYYCRLHQSNEVRILEYGMGTALNVALTYQYCLAQGVPVHFHTLEAFPLPSSIYSQLDYFEGEEKKQLVQIHELSWKKIHHLSAHFALRKEKVHFERFKSDQKFDIIYYDAFAPTCQPHLWEKEVLSVAYQSLTKNGILVTFCAKGSFKRALKSLGFVVDGIPGPPRKREMVRATKKE